MIKSNKYLIVPFATLVICQLIKFTIESIREKKIVWGRLFSGCGGMPSSHTSFCFSITMMIGYNEGFQSMLFALALIVSMVIAYDAMGLRMESGKQAVAINQIVGEVFKGKHRNAFEHLKEELGHNPIEVVGGIFLAIVTSSLFTIFIG